jgi:hypothetical protein
MCGTRESENLALRYEQLPEQRKLTSIQTAVKKNC